MKAKICLVLVTVCSLAVAAAASTTWTVVPSANRDTVSSLLNGVTVIARNDVWAVGHWYDTQLASYRTLAEHWDGARWKIAATPNIGNGYNDLNAVAAANQSDAWAVGYSRQSSYSNSRTLILHWDGTVWQVVPSPSPGPADNTLYGVTAISPGDAWAVGWYYDAQFVGRPLFLHWNGTRWDTVAAPGVSTYVNALQAVTATGPADVWAGGYAYVSGRYVTFVEHWDGSAWKVVPSPNVGTKHNRIRGLSASSPQDVWAVGDSYTGGSLVEHWDGAAWSVIDHPIPAGRHTFWSVSALQANDVWAAGYVNDSSGLRPLIQHWDGVNWAQNVVPSAGVNPWLTAVAGLPMGDVWTVGAVGPNTLTLRAVR